MRQQNGMGAAVITSRTAWIVALLLVMQASLALFRVRALPATSASAFPARAWLLTAHAILGFVLPPLTLMHAWNSMRLPGASGTSAPGLWIATGALLLLVVQAASGASLLRRNQLLHSGTRRLHLAMAAVLVVLAGIHVVLNG